MKKYNLLISIIIPAWNVEQYISKALESCIAQTYTDLDILVVDDASEDCTCEIVGQYCKKDPRVRLEKKEHEGVSAARNKGIELAKGQMAIFLDSDDWLNCDAIQILVKSYQEHPGYLIGAKPTFVSEQEQCSCISDSVDKECAAVVLSQHDALMNTDTDYYRNASACYKLFSLDVIRSNHLKFDKEVLFGEDGLFVFCYLNHVKGMVYHNVSIWNVLMRSTSSTRLRYNEKFMTSIYGVEKMLAYPHEKSDEIDTMLKKFLVTKSLNMIRRYLDCGNTDSVIPKQYRYYIRKYKTAYLKTATAGETIRTIMILYVPFSIYAAIYRKTHCVQ